MIQIHKEQCKTMCYVPFSKHVQPSGTLLFVFRAIQRFLQLMLFTKVSNPSLYASIQTILDWISEILSSRIGPGPQYLKTKVIPTGTRRYQPVQTRSMTGPCWYRLVQVRSYKKEVLGPLFFSLFCIFDVLKSGLQACSRQGYYSGQRVL